MRELDVIARRVRSPLLVGPSRKRFIGEVREGAAGEDRVAAAAAADDDLLFSM